MMTLLIVMRLVSFKTQMLSQLTSTMPARAVSFKYELTILLHIDAYIDPYKNRFKRILLYLPPNPNTLIQTP